MRDRSEYARKGIARGRSVVVTLYAGGVLFVAENHSPTLHKVSEIYDRIGFAAVGRYNEFENLRTAGIRLADVRGFSYDRRDVTGRWLANAYAQTLGLDLLRAPEAVRGRAVRRRGRPAARGRARLVTGDSDGTAASGDQLYRIAYDGSIVEERRFVVMGGVTEPVITALQALVRRPAGICRRRWPRRSRALGAAGESAPRDAAADAARGRRARPVAARPDLPPAAGHRARRAARIGIASEIPSGIPADTEPEDSVTPDAPPTPGQDDDPSPTSELIAGRAGAPWRPRDVGHGRRRTSRCDVSAPARGPPARVFGQA